MLACSERDSNPLDTINHQDEGGTQQIWAVACSNLRRCLQLYSGRFSAEPPCPPKHTHTHMQRHYMHYNYTEITLKRLGLAKKAFCVQAEPLDSKYTLFCHICSVGQIWNYLVIGWLFSCIQLLTTECCVIKPKAAAWGEAGDYQFVLHLRTSWKNNIHFLLLKD